jgi:hypothetical protein
MGRIYEVSHSDGPSWHYILAKYYEDGFRHASNIITATI